jgi:type 1 fimbriae regulatory protein FimB/type 1 fimbriae regulatory protein FimE
VHPLQGDEMRALRELKRSADSPFVFTSERGTPFTRAGFAKMVARLGQEAKFKFGVHPHMLRHACGYALANRGHDTRALQAYLGHKNIQHTVRYTELSPTRFKDFWRAATVGVCPAGVTSLIKGGALSGREPLHERLGAFENLGRSGDPR